MTVQTRVHEHDISTDLINTPPNPNTYLTFQSAGFKPATADYHNIPLLKPIPAGADPGSVNYKNQLEQLNKYLQLTEGLSMPRNPDGSLNPTNLPNNSNYAMGYLAGDGGQDPPNVTVFDFRAVYFGNDLNYSVGTSAGSPVLAANSPITDEAFIWVNENEGSADYMKVASTQINADYNKFLYKQIPPGKVILVKDGLVKIGNYKP